MRKSKQKIKFTREPQHTENSIEYRKRAKQYVVRRMVMTYLESKMRVDVYGNVKEIIDDFIAVSPWTKEESQNCAARRHKNKRSNNQLLDQEEAEADNSKHQTTLLSFISSTTVNDRRSKLPTLKKKEK